MLPVLQIRRERETIKMFVSDEEEKPTTHTHTHIHSHNTHSHPSNEHLYKMEKETPSTLSIGYKQS